MAVQQVSQVGGELQGFRGRIDGAGDDHGTLTEKVGVGFVCQFPGDIQVGGIDHRSHGN